MADHAAHGYNQTNAGILTPGVPPAPARPHVLAGCRPMMTAADVKQAAGVFAALAEPTRVHILHQLIDGPRYVGQLQGRRISKSWEGLALRLRLHLSVGAYDFPSTRSTTQHPRACGPWSRQWVSTSALSHPASWSASARIGSRSNARSS